MIRYRLGFGLFLFYIGPESDYCLMSTLVSNSLTDSLTNCPLVNLINLTLACEDGNSKLVEVVTVVNVDDEDRVGVQARFVW